MINNFVYLLSLILLAVVLSSIAFNKSVFLLAVFTGIGSFYTASLFMYIVFGPPNLPKKSKKDNAKANNNKNNFFMLTSILLCKINLK